MTLIVSFYLLLAHNVWLDCSSGLTGGVTRTLILWQMWMKSWCNTVLAKMLIFIFYSW